MDPQFFAVWFIQMVVLFLVIKWAIDHSKATEEIRDLKRKLEDYIEKQNEQRE